MQVFITAFCILLSLTVESWTGSVAYGIITGLLSAIALGLWRYHYEAIVESIGYARGYKAGLDDARRQVLTNRRSRA